MLKHRHFISALLACALILTACTAIAGASTSEGITKSAAASAANETQIVLSDDGVTVDGAAASTDESSAVYTANDVVFYLEGQDFTYGEGSESDAHSQAEADAHIVVHIAKAGTYRVSGTLSAGQIAIDLGEDAKSDPEAVVTLILDNADITCTVAPAIIFYRVYECGSDDADTAASEVDTSAAGANLILADGSENRVSGSYVAKIYKSYELSEDGKSVVDSKKLHKYDGAVYSKMSMNVDGGGSLQIDAENEGLDSELHLTINGGTIRIESNDDGINTNEDGVSVTTINGGDLTVRIKDGAAEGDGIDSNGWIVVNGGTVHAYACAASGDSGLDSDNGILLNGGTVVATGNMLDAIGEGGMGGFGGMTPPDFANGERPDFANGQRPDFANGERPDFANGQRPDFANGERPDFANGERPDFANGGRPDFGGTPLPDAADGAQTDGSAKQSAPAAAQTDAKQASASDTQTYAVFSFTQRQSAGEYEITDSAGNTFTAAAENGFTVLLFSSPELADGACSIAKDGKTLASSGGANGGFGRMGGMGGFGGMTPPDFANGQRPDFGGQRPDFGGQRPDFANGQRPDFANGQRPDFANGAQTTPQGLDGSSASAV